MLRHSIKNLVTPYLDDVAVLFCRDEIQRRRRHTAIGMTRSAADTGRLMTPSPSTSGDTSARRAGLRTIS